jgi:hypothetical protein
MIVHYYKCDVCGAVEQEPMAERNGRHYCRNELCQHLMKQDSQLKRWGGAKYTKRWIPPMVWSEGIGE